MGEFTVAFMVNPLERLRATAFLASVEQGYAAVLDKFFLLEFVETN
jgi:hypothetical protein